MKPEQIHLGDLHRLLIGQAPTVFLVEIVIRAVFTYLVLLAAMRLMGKRVAAQMSGLELTVIVTLGAAVGVPLQAPDRGLMPALVILLIAIVYQRGLNFWAFKSRRAELALQGDVEVIIRDGVLDLSVMRHSVLSRERLFSVLRQSKIVHLGQVKRAYIEADGRFSVYEIENPPPGLCILPSVDGNSLEQLSATPEHFACCLCGNVVHESRVPTQCKLCDGRKWSTAVKSTKLDKLQTRDAMNPGTVPQQ